VENLSSTRDYRALFAIDRQGTNNHGTWNYQRPPSTELDFTS
jgi:hypothetical protein